MEPISIILTALVTGAAAALKSTAQNAVKDAYCSIKSFIKNKYKRISIDMLENDPVSKERQNIVKEDLKKAEAGNDEELLRKAKLVLDAIHQYAPQESMAMGVSLEYIKGASLKIDDIIASGSGVTIKKADLDGDITITGVRAGASETSSNP